jgi:hypothetical protein
MQQKQETSGFAAILKTIAFFAVVVGIIGASVYFGTGGEIASKSNSEGYRYVDIADLADYDYYTPYPGEKPDENLLAKNKIPESVKRLDGQRVSITGFMLPVRVDSNGYVSEFALNGNYDMCFYGAPSRINQWVHVKMKSGAKARFSHNPTMISGTLEVGELVENGQVISLYRLHGEKATTVSGRGF